MQVDKMASLKLTKRVVDGAQPRDSRYTLFDAGEGGVKGFGLRVFPSGKKSWIFEYRAGGGGRQSAKKRITIGSVGDFTTDEARRRADMLRAKTKIGEDPQAEKSETRKAMTVAELSAIFLADHVESKRKLSTHGHYEDILERIVLPAIGTMKAKDVSRADVARIHLAWRRTPFQANRMLAIVGSMYGFAGRRGIVQEGVNPARSIEKYAEDRRERFLSISELERLGAAIREAETTGIPWEVNLEKKSKHVPKGKRKTAIGQHAAAALRLLIFTGARLREILHLKWSEVDLQRGLFLLPDSKTGRKTIVLNAPAIAVLSTLPRIGDFVVASESTGTDHEKPRSDLKRPWAMVSRHAGLDGVRLHDLRHTYASYGASGGLGLPMIGKLLGHVEARTTQRYAHLDNDPLRKASEAIANTIASAMGEGKESGKIVQLKRS
jgi:integrase